MTDLKYPIGKFAHEGKISRKQRSEWIKDIKTLPKQLKEAVAGLSDEQLDTPYRHEGWTVRQVIHHIADSHMNSMVRFKLALTEDTPTVKPYNEADWANLADSKMPVKVSLELIKHLHARWVVLLKSMTSEDFAKSFMHPTSQTTSSLDRVLGIYAWHGKHHLAHITELKKRKNW
jgi:uncharacterized damage-inducible protein DinB